MFLDSQIDDSVLFAIPISFLVQFLEVFSKTLDRIHRFAVRTTAGAAVSIIDRKIKRGHARPLHIEAIKQGEIPIAFGPDALLVDYGPDWKLHTFTEREATYIKADDRYAENIIYP